MLDWIVGYSTITHPVLEVSLYYTIPGLLQKIIPDSSEPSKQGWMYLSKSKTWTLDTRITVTSYWAREQPGDQPCEVVTGLDYPGQDIHQSWQDSRLFIRPPHRQLSRRALKQDFRKTFLFGN